MGLITPSYKNVIITETRSRSISFENRGNTMTVPRSRCTMTFGSQTRKEAPQPTRSLVHPKNTLKIGNWNVRTLYRTGHLAQAAREMNRGRPKTTWRRTVEREMKEGGWGSWDEVRGVAVDRQKWKASVKALCATWHAEDR